jgi:translation elongation factor EF-1alpha
MNSNIVFFGPADHGKSTIIGYTLADFAQKDMDKVARELKNRLGSDYKPDYLYSSLINPERESDIMSRFSTRINSIKRIISFTFIDTPGHDKLLDQREQGIALGQIGVFCLAINEVLNEKYEEAIHEFTNLWFEHYKNRRLICLLTKFDLRDFRQNDYEEASERIKKCCRQIEVTYRVEPLGAYFEYNVTMSGFAAIIPVSVDFNKRRGHNILSRSDKTSWYEGPTMIGAIKERVNELAKS